MEVVVDEFVEWVCVLGVEVCVGYFFDFVIIMGFLVFVW